MTNFLFQNTILVATLLFGFQAFPVNLPLNECETAMISPREIFAYQVPMTDLEKKELVRIATRELQARWRLKNLNDVNEELLDRLTMIRFLGGSILPQLDNLSSLSILRRHPLSEETLLEKAELLLNPSHPPAELLSEPYSYADVGGLLELVDEPGAVRAVIAEAIARENLRMAVNLIARNQTLSPETHDRLLRLIEGRILVKSPVMMNLKTLINIYSLLMTPERQRDKRKLLHRYGRELIDSALIERGFPVTNSSFSPPSAFAGAMGISAEQRFEIGVEALRATGEVVDYKSDASGLIRPVTKIIQAAMVKKMLKLIDDLLKQLFVDRDVDFGSLMELAFSLNAPENESLVRPLARQWLNTLIRTMNNLLPSSRQPKGTSILVVKAYAEAIAQLARMVDRQDVIIGLLHRTMDLEILSLDAQQFSTDGLVFKIWSQLSKENREAGYKIIEEKTDKFSFRLFNEAISNGSNLVVSRYWPKPYRSAKTFSSESSDRVLGEISKFRQRIDSTRFSQREAKNDRLPMDQESIQRKEKALIEARDGQGLLKLARHIDANSESMPVNGISAVEVFLIGLMVGP